MRDSKIEEIYKKYNLTIPNKDIEPTKKKRKDVVSSSDDEEPHIVEPKRRSKKKDKKRRKIVEENSDCSDYSDDANSSDDESKGLQKFSINRKMKSKLDAEGVELVNSLIKFIPRHGDQEAIWQQIKKCITLPPVQLYTKAAVMNYLKKKEFVQ